MRKSLNMILRLSVSALAFGTLLVNPALSEETGSGNGTDASKQSVMEIKGKTKLEDTATLELVKGAKVKCGSYDDDPESEDGVFDFGKGKLKITSDDAEFEIHGKLGPDTDADTGSTGETPDKRALKELKDHKPITLTFENGYLAKDAKSETPTSFKKFGFDHAVKYTRTGGTADTTLDAICKLKGGETWAQKKVISGNDLTNLLGNDDGGQPRVTAGENSKLNVTYKGGPIHNSDHIGMKIDKGSPRLAFITYNLESPIAKAIVKANKNEGEEVENVTRKDIVDALTKLKPRFGTEYEGFKKAYEDHTKEATINKMGAVAKRLVGAAVEEVQDVLSRVKVVDDTPFLHQVAPSFYTVDGYEEYQEPTEESGNVKSYRFTPVGDNGEELTGWRMQALDDSIIVKTLPASEINRNTEYESNLRARGLDLDGRIPTFSYSGWRITDPLSLYTGDNSWFNGTYVLHRGGAIIEQEGKMFGGKVQIGTGEYPTELEWQGGAKDTNNRPDISIADNSTLYFNLPRKNSVFSVYGSVSGTDKSMIVFEQGNVKIKGDWSNYRGYVGVAPDATFDIVRDRDHNGILDNLKFVVLEKDGVSHKASHFKNSRPVTINSNNMRNLRFLNGHAILKNSNGGRINLSGAEIGSGAFVQLDQNADIRDVKVKGALVTSAGDNDTLENVDIDGGILFMRNASTTTNNLSVASTLVQWGDNTYKQFEVKDNLTIKDTWKLFSDAKFKGATGGDGEIDSIKIGSKANVEKGGGIAVGGLDLWNIANIGTKVKHTFHILDANGFTDIPVHLGAKYGEDPTEFTLYSEKQIGTEELKQGTKLTEIDSTTTLGKIGESTYNPKADDNGISSTVKQVYSEDGGDYPAYISFTNDGKDYYIQGSDKGGLITISDTAPILNGDGDILNDGFYGSEVASMHLAGAKSMAGIFDMISDSFGNFNGAFVSDKATQNSYSAQGIADEVNSSKWSIWNKTFGEDVKFDTKTSSNIKSKDWGTIFGFDAKPISIGSSNTEFVPTIFAGLSHANLKYDGLKAGQNGYLFGGKAAFFDSKKSLELLGSYELLKTKSNIGTAIVDKIKMKGHVWSLGAKAGYNFDLSYGLRLRPTLLLGYSFIDLPTFNGGKAAKDVKSDNLHRFELVPGFTFSKIFNTVEAGLLVAYHENFGKKAKQTTSYNTVWKPDIMKKRFLEYGVTVSKVTSNDRFKIGANLTRKTLGVKGFKATVNFGIKF